MSLKLSQCRPELQERIRKQIAVESGSEPSAFVPEIRQGKRIRQDSKPLMNKLETEFFLRLECQYGDKIRPQARRYKLGNGIWFKPDFTSIIESQEIAWEVKGPHAFRGGFENLKVAAHEWPEVDWFLCWKENGEWKQQKVLP